MASTPLAYQELTHSPRVTRRSPVTAVSRRALTFKDAVNSAIRSALTPGGDPSRDVPLPAFDMGEPRVPLEHALRLAADLADEEIARKLAGGK